MDTNKKLGKILRGISYLVGILAAVVPTAAFAAPGNFKEFVDLILKLLNSVVGIIIALAFVVFIWGVFKYVTSGADEDKVKEGRDYIIYGLIGLFVMVSVWGLVKLFAGTFFR